MARIAFPMLLPALLASAVFAGAIFVFADEPPRDWTNSAGKTISAALTEVQGQTITLRTAAGRSYQVDLSTLTAEDQTYVKQWQADREADALREATGAKLGLPLDPIVQTPFDQETPPTRKGEVEGWTTGIGEWRIEEGSLVGDELPEDNHASSLTYRLEATGLIITAQIMLGTAENLTFAFRDTVPPNNHLGRLYITPDSLWIQHMSGIAQTTKNEKLVTENAGLERDAWYDVTIEIIGDRFRAQVGEHEIEAAHPRFADAIGIVALVNRGQGARFRNVAIWSAQDRE